MMETQKMEKTAAPVLTLLCVDDEPGVLASLRRSLRGEAFTVHTAGSGSEGLALLETTPVDIVVSDMRMPQMDGAEFLTQVAINYPDTARILLTGYADMDSTIKAINGGKIESFISKPWNKEELLLILKQSAARLALERRNVQLMSELQHKNQQLSELTEQLEERVKQRTVQLRKSVKQLEQSNRVIKSNLMSTVKTFYNLLSLNPALGGECAKQIAHVGRSMAAQLGLDAKQTQAIYLAGLLCETGLLGADEALLKTPLHDLRGEAKKTFYAHPKKAQDALQTAHGLEHVVQAIACQFEHFDGSGTPARIYGAQIPVEARVLMVARDYVYAMQGRLDLARHSEEGALAMLKPDLHTVYDPHVFDALIRSVESELSGDSHAVNELSLPVGQLLQGMVLSRDLFSKNNLLLLPEGHEFTFESIERLHHYQKGEKFEVEVFILASSAQS